MAPHICGTECCVALVETLISLCLPGVLLTEGVTRLWFIWEKFS